MTIEFSVKRSFCKNPNLREQETTDGHELTRMRTVTARRRNKKPGRDRNPTIHERPKSSHRPMHNFFAASPSIHRESIVTIGISPFFGSWAGIRGGNQHLNARNKIVTEL